MKGLLPPPDRTLMLLLGAGRGGHPVPPLPLEEWDGLCRQALDHGAAPLLYARLRCRAGVPARVLDALRPHYLRSAAESTHRFRHLGGLLSRFREEGLAVVVLKGAYLAEAAYGNTAVRPMSDVDLLVRESDLPRARALLLAEGFRQPRQAPLEMELLADHHLFPFVREGGRALVVELHWRLMPPRIHAADPAALWERTREAQVAGEAVRALDPADLLLHIAVHACLQHRLTTGVMPLLDVDVILRTFGSEIDWDAFGARALEWGAGESLALLLDVVRELCDAPVPPGLTARLAPRGVAPALRELACRQIFRERTAAPYLSITLTRLFHTRGPAAFLAILAERFFPPRREILLRYPVPSAIWLPLLYLVHPLVLIAIHSRSALRLLAGRGGELDADSVQQRGEALVQALRRGAGADRVPGSPRPAQ